VFFCVGVSDEERANPQRLLLTVDLDFDFSSAAVSDRITKSIDYDRVVQLLLKYGEGRSWKLIEKVANDIADRVLSDFQPQGVNVEMKKFPYPQARWVSVRLSKGRTNPGMIKRTSWGIP
jgi:7,8-dihydroneopterin aldolase/epimerase/oxygenase